MSRFALRKPKNKINMTLLMNPSVTEENESTSATLSEISEVKNEGLTIISSHTLNHPCNMSDEMKARKQNDAPCMAKLFEKSLKEKGEFDTSNINWLDNHTVEVKGLSGMALQNFVLKAEAHGKCVTYTKQTIIKIEN